jgi:uncharacterized protein YraI
MLELGCVIAVNLDGGGSSEMIVNGSIKNKPSDGAERSIGTAFVAYAKKSINDNTNKKTVTASSLNVRTGPGTNYSKIGLLYKGATVIVISTANGWSRVQYNGSSLGYVSAQYLS